MSDTTLLKRTWRRSSLPDLLTDSEEQGVWLISYADLMTLLVGLFIMMFSFASFDQKSAARMNKALKGTFGADSDRKAVEKLATSIESAMAMTPYFRDMKLIRSDHSLEVSFGTAALFSSADADLTSDADKAIRALAERVHTFGPTSRVRVEGYADDNPIASAKYPSNWVLSGARASTIVQLFETVGFQPERLETAGFGATRPLLPNRSVSGIAIPENQAKNRRVTIKIILDGKDTD